MAGRHASHSQFGAHPRTPVLSPRERSPPLRPPTCAGEHNTPGSVRKELPMQGSAKDCQLFIDSLAVPQGLVALLLGQHCPAFVLMGQLVIAHSHHQGGVGEPACQPGIEPPSLAQRYTVCRQPGLGRLTAFSPAPTPGRARSGTNRRCLHSPPTHPRSEMRKGGHLALQGVVRRSRQLGGPPPSAYTRRGRPLGPASVADAPSAAPGGEEGEGAESSRGGSGRLGRVGAAGGAIRGSGPALRLTARRPCAAQALGAARGGVWAGGGAGNGGRGGRRRGGWSGEGGGGEVVVLRKLHLLGGVPGDFRFFRRAGGPGAAGQAAGSRRRDVASARPRGARSAARRPPSSPSQYTDMSTNGSCFFAFFSSHLDTVYR